MPVDVAILVTDWEWVEQSRPELRVDAGRTTARLEMGPIRSISIGRTSRKHES